jgi:hypothetical protein
VISAVEIGYVRRSESKQPARKQSAPPKRIFDAVCMLPVMAIPKALAPTVSGSGTL